MSVSVIFEMSKIPEIAQEGGSKRLQQAALRDIALLYQREIIEEYENQNVTNTGALAAMTKVIGSRSDTVFLTNESKQAAAIEFGSVNYSTAPPIGPLILWLQQRFGLSGKPLLSAARALQEQIKTRGTPPRPVWQTVLTDSNIAQEAKRLLIERLRT